MKPVHFVHYFFYVSVELLKNCWWIFLTFWEGVPSVLGIIYLLHSVSHFVPMITAKDINLKTVLMFKQHWKHLKLLNYVEFLDAVCWNGNGSAWFLECIRTAFFCGYIISKWFPSEMIVLYLWDYHFLNIFGTVLAYVFCQQYLPCHYPPLHFLCCLPLPLPWD